MDRTQEERQLQRVKEKLARMAESDPNLLCLEPPAEEELAAAIEGGRGVALPWDYRRVITQAGDGGRLPQRFWYTLPEAAERGDGELLLTGNGRLGWVLRIQGPFAGEVWTVCGQRLLRVPGCTFVQWLELELDEDLESYLGYCLTGKDTELTQDRDLLTLLETPPEWGEEDPAEHCARWLEDNRFVHEGPSEQWTSYLKGHLSSALRPRPQERSQALIFRRQAQEDGSWQWDEETARRWKDAYRASPKVYGRKDTDTLFGNCTLTEDVDTLLPLHPQRQWAANGRPVPEWILSIVSITENRILGQLEYQEAMKRLLPFSLAKSEDWVLIRAMTHQELDGLFEGLSRQLT